MRNWAHAHDTGRELSVTLYNYIRFNHSVFITIHYFLLFIVICIFRFWINFFPTTLNGLCPAEYLSSPFYRLHRALERENCVSPIHSTSPPAHMYIDVGNFFMSIQKVSFRSTAGDGNSKTTNCMQ